MGGGTDSNNINYVLFNLLLEFFVSFPHKILI